jgi:hypothetical protein
VPALRGSLVGRGADRDGRSRVHPGGSPTPLPLALARKEGARGGTTGFPTPNALPIFVFELAEGNIRRVAAGERVGTIIHTEHPG